jgi:hypothetical protein
MLNFYYKNLSSLFFIMFLGACSCMSNKPLSYLESNIKLDEAEKAFIEKKLRETETFHGTEIGLRVFVESSDADFYYIHIGSSDPYKGGSGANYSLNRVNGAIKMESLEEYAPAPVFNEAGKKYIINNIEATEEEYNGLKETLLPKQYDWYCDEMPSGGATGYKLKDSKGSVYQVEEEDNEGSTIFSIIEMK